MKNLLVVVLVKVTSLTLHNSSSTVTVEAQLKNVVPGPRDAEAPKNS